MLTTEMSLYPSGFVKVDVNVWVEPVPEAGETEVMCGEEPPTLQAPTVLQDSCIPLVSVTLA